MAIMSGRKFEARRKALVTRPCKGQHELTIDLAAYFATLGEESKSSAELEDWAWAYYLKGSLFVCCLEHFPG